MRIIDADALDIMEYREEFPNGAEDRGWNAAVRIINDYIQKAPALDYKDLVPQGEWIGCRGGNATCSRCRIRQKAVYDDDNEQHFCGHCGARMVSK